MKIIFPDVPPPRVVPGDKLVTVSLKHMLRAQPSKVVHSGHRREHAASLCGVRLAGLTDLGDAM